MIFLYITYIIGAILGINGISKIFRLFRTFSFLKKSHEEALENTFSEKKVSFIILIPALRESKIILKTLKRFSQFSTLSISVKIVLITTEREFEHEYHHNNTISLIKETLPSLNRKTGNMFLHIHYPYKTGFKSDQLNYAIRVISNSYPSLLDEYTYIGVYDADSTTDKNVLRFIAQDATRNNYPAGYQQPSLYFKNYSILPTTLSGFFARGFCFIHSVYAVAYETYTLIQESSKHNLPRPPRIRYMIGHGLFIKWTQLKHINLFPSPIEDTRLGHVLSFLKKEIRVIPYFDACTVTQNIISSIKQASVWFIGVAHFLKDFRIARKAEPIPLMFGWWLVIHKFYRNTIWILEGFVFILFITDAFVFQQWLLLIVVLLFYLYVPPTILYLMLKKNNTLAPIALPAMNSLSNLLIVALIMPIERLIMSVGPLWGLSKLIYWNINKNPLFLPKTEK